MEWFSSLIISICAASICLGALYIICPDGKMSKSVKYVFSLCFLLIIISAAGINIKKADFDFEFKSDNEIDISDNEIASAKFVYSMALKNAGIEFYEIEISTDNSIKNGISISEIIVYTNSSESEIIAALGQAAENIEVIVINE